MGAAVFVVEGRYIELYPDAEAAAAGTEGYDAMDLDFLGADGTVYEATVEGPLWGPVRLHRTQENRLADLISLLRSEAAARAVPLPPGIPDHPEEIWDAVLSAQQASRRPGRCRSVTREADPTTRRFPRYWYRRFADLILDRLWRGSRP